MRHSKHSTTESGNGSVETSVLLFAQRHPLFGQAKVARELSVIGQPISPSGVRYIWKKHNLETAYKRLKSLEKLPDQNARTLTASQMAILKRGNISKRVAKKSRGASARGEMATPEERQEQILNAAAELFVKQGYGGTSIRDIANQVGLLPGSVYHYFPSKEDLFVAIHREGFRQLVSRCKIALGQQEYPWNRLEAACVVHIDSAVAGNAIDRITAIGLFAIHEDHLQKRLQKDRKNYDQQFRKLVDDLDLPRETDRSIFRLALLGSLNWSITWFRPGKMTPREIAHELIRTFRGTSRSEQPSMGAPINA